MTELAKIRPRLSRDVVRIIDAWNIGIRQGPSTRIVSWSDVVCVRSEKKYSWIQTTHETLRSAGTLADIVKTIGPLGLVRIHRGVAVNSNRVRRLAGHGRHRVTLTLDTGDEFLIGRQFQRAVYSRFGFRA